MSLRRERSAPADNLTVSRYSCCSGVRSVSRASSVMPMIPFIGVRNSWLILARNSPLWRLAASAGSSLGSPSPALVKFFLEEIAHHGEIPQAPLQVLLGLPQHLSRAVELEGLLLQKRLSLL